VKSLILSLALLASPVLAESATDCLGKAIYNEAKGEDLRGQLLVAKVIMNRVDHPSYPDTICGVVNQRGQFNRRATNHWESLVTAELILQEELRLPETEALYFYSGAKPKYLKAKTFLFKHGGHHFYK
jgi:spore germination cell wall hydrolase CwlJ-like protein